VVERETSGDFDYLWDDPADGDGLTSDDEVLAVQPAEKLGAPPKDPGDGLWDEPDDNFWDNQPNSDDFPNEDGQFDAFNDNTWRFTPTSPQWYRTKLALTAILAASAAVAAIVVSGVLLVTSTGPEPPLPPPPPPETASSVNPAPRYNPTYQPRPTKAPEIGVTRTPVTRAPISVAPQPRTGQGGLR
jgi:hypothetical protein